MRLDSHSQEGVYARKKFLEVRIFFACDGCAAECDWCKPL